MIECKHSCKGGHTNAAIGGAFDKVIKEKSYVKQRIRTIFSKGDEIIPIWIIATRGHKNGLLKTKRNSLKEALYIYQILSWIILKIVTRFQKIAIFLLISF